MNRARAITLLALLFGALSAAAQSNNYNVGLPQNGVFDGTGIESVQVNNGDLHIEIPLFTVAGRGLSVPVSYVYDNKGWWVRGGEDLPKYIRPALGNQPNQQWRVSAPLIDGAGIKGGVSGTISCLGTPTNTAPVVGYVYVEPNGTSHPFSPIYNGAPYCGSNYTGNLIYANDGSGYAIQLGTPTKLVAPDGTYAYFNSNVTMGYLVDSHGNQLTRALNGSSPVPPTPLAQPYLTDTLGRTVQVDAVLNSQTGKYELKYYDSAGTQQTIVVTKSPVSVSTPYCGTACHNYVATWQMPTEILLPNGMKYGISYAQNSYGMPASITLPTGATVSYTWGSTAACGSGGTGFYDADAAGPRVKSRTVTNGGQTSTWTYTYQCGSFTNQIWHEATIETLPTGDEVVHTFTSYPVAITDDLAPSRETQLDSYSGPRSNNVLLKSVQTVYQDSSVGPNLPISVTTTWPQQGNLVSRTETDWYTFPNNITQTWIGNWFPNVSWGNPVEKREYAFGVGAEGALVRKTHFQYAHLSGNTNYNSNYKTLNIANRVTQKTVYDVPNGNVIVADSKTAYDGNTIGAITGVPGHITPSTQYRGNPTQSSVWRNLPSVAWLATNNTYNDLGNLTSTQDPGGHTTTFSYADSWSGTGCGVGSNAQAFLTESDAPDTTNSQGATVHHRSRTKYFPCTGQKQLSQDENDILAGPTRGTSYTYDSMLRPLTVNASDGGQTSFTYGDTANSVSVTTTTKIDTNGNNRVEVSNHDGLGRVKNTVLQDSVGPYAEGDITTDTTYDLLGRVSCVTNPHRAISSSTDGQTCYQYDALGRKTQETPPDGPAAGVVTYNYGAQTTGTLGLTTTITDQAGKKRMSVNDALGQLVDVWEQSDSAGTLGWETAYQYDTLGNLKRVDQKGGDANSANWRTRTFTYDSLSRLLTANNPESGTICWGTVSGGICQNNGYDADSNVIYKTDAKGTTITYNYDALHRVATEGATHAKSYSNGDAPVDYFFDQTSYNNLTIAEGVGKQTGMHDATGDSAWTFDSEGRTTTENQTINIAGLTSSAITKSISYFYNLDGSLKTMTYPSGRVVNYAYSTIGRTGSVADTGTGGATYLSWSPPSPAICSSDNHKRYSVHGEELCLNHGNNIISYNAFNNRFQPSLLSAAGASGTVLSLGYTFTDANSKNNGLLWKITNNKDTTRSQNFTYDQLNRIQSAWTDGNLWGNDFTIDPWGNLTAKAVHAGKPLGESLTVTANNKNQLNTYSYDNNGNLLNDQLGHNFTFDAENRPYSAGGVTYYYDGTGERVAKSNSKLYWFQDDNEPVAESDALGNVSYEFIFANGRRWARRDTNGTIHYYFSDQINSSNVIANANGSTIEFESDFYPYGGERVLVADTIGNNYKFTGKERDPETNYDFFGARFYSSSFGRFLTPDWSAAPEAIPYAKPGLPQTLNLYSYVANNPITGIDPDGHDPSPYIGDAAGWYDCLVHSCPDSQKDKDKKEKSKNNPDAVGKELANTLISLYNQAQIAACYVSSSCKKPQLEAYLEPQDETERKEMDNIGIALMILPGEGQARAGAELISEGGLSKYWKELEEHHVLPQQFRPAFEKMGIDIDRYTVRIYRWKHRMKEVGLHSKGWNKEWQRFLRNPKNRNPAKVFNKALRMIRDAGVGGGPM